MIQFVPVHYLKTVYSIITSNYIKVTDDYSFFTCILLTNVTTACNLKGYLLLHQCLHPTIYQWMHSVMDCLCSVTGSACFMVCLTQVDMFFRKRQTFHTMPSIHSVRHSGEQIVKCPHRNPNVEHLTLLLQACGLTPKILTLLEFELGTISTVTCSHDCQNPW